MNYYKKGWLEYQQVTPIQGSWNIINTGFLLQNGIKVENFAYFPLMNNSPMLKSVDIYSIPKKEAKNIEKMISSSAEDLKNKLPSMAPTKFIYHGTSEPQLNKEKNIISFNNIIATGLGGANPGAKYNLSLKMKSPEDFNRIREQILNHICLQNNETKVLEPPPQCKCGSLKSLNADYMHYSKQGPIPE